MGTAELLYKWAMRSFSHAAGGDSLNDHYEFDVYLAHATTDKPFVRRLSAQLESQGWRVWLDEARMVAGRTIRQQLDAGLTRSRFVAVVVSPSFLDATRQWPKRELDAAFALEGDGSTRVLPVWLNVDEPMVRSFSPILASMFAVVTVQGNAIRTAQELDRSMEQILDESDELQWSDFIRSDIREGLLWTKPPQLFANSLRELDDRREFYWAGRASAVIAGEKAINEKVLTPSLPEVFEQPSRFEGKRVLVIGHQVAQQLLTYGRGVIYQYVLQVKSADPNYKANLLYVLLAERSDGEPDVPNSPPDYLVSALGVVVARGAMTVSTGETYSAVYMVAARLYYFPKITD